MKISKSISSLIFQFFLFSGLLLVSLHIAADQMALEREFLSDKPSVKMSEQVSSNVFVFSLSEKIETHGIQFQLKYNPEQTRVVSIESCLSNLPAELSSGVTSCLHIEEQSLIQVVITDLSKQTKIPTSSEIGFVEFESLTKGKIAEVTIDQVYAVGYEGSDLKNVVSAELIQL